MHVGTDHVPPSLPSLEARLKELGWINGRNIRLIWRNLEPDEADGQAKEFVRERVNVIVAFEDQSIRAAQAATARPKDHIPVVFLHPSDPVRDGLVKSLSHPGGNLTGVFGARDVVAKQLELYQLLVPRLRRVLTLVDPTDPGTGRLLAQYRAAASQLRPSPELVIRDVSTARDLKRVFGSLRPGEIDGAFLLSLEASAQLLGADDPPGRPREAPGAGPQEGLGQERRALLLRGRPSTHRTAGGPLRRQHPQGGSPFRLVRRGCPGRRVRDQSEDREQARHPRPTADDHSSGRGLPVAHRRLIWKYTAVVVTLVAAAVISVGLTELYFSYQDSKRALTGFERDKASSAATSIEQLVQDLLLELDAVAQPTTSTGNAGLQERNQDFHRLLDRDRSISRVSYVDANGHERVRTSALETDRIGTGADLSRSHTFLVARAKQRYFSRVHFENGSPHLTVSVAERAPGHGVVVADIDLHSIRQVIDRAHVGTAGYAYAVDSRGELVTHPNINLVLRHTSFASLPQVRAALRGRANAAGDRARIGRDRARDESAQRVPDDQTARLARVRRAAAQRGFRPAQVRDLAHRFPAGRLPAAGHCDERPARSQAGAADRVDPGCGGEDRFRFAQPADRGSEQ